MCVCATANGNEDDYPWHRYTHTHTHIYVYIGVDMTIHVAAAKLDGGNAKVALQARPTERGCECVEATVRTSCPAMLIYR